MSRVIYRDPHGGMYLCNSDATGMWVALYYQDNNTLVPEQIARMTKPRLLRAISMRSRLALDHPDSQSRKHLREHFT